MNLIEKTIYELVKDNPKVKTSLRNTYQSLFDLFPKKRFKTDLPLVNRVGYFFGFHDHTPFSHNGKFMLAQKAPSGLFMPTSKDKLRIGFFTGDEFKEFNDCCISNAWNWHMGCKLQWLGKSNSIIFNDLDKNKAISKIINVESSKQKIIDCHISSASPNGDFIVGYDFLKVERYMPGYGYRLENKKIINQAEDSMNLYFYNLKDNLKKKMFNVSELKEIDPENSMKNALHFITHAVFSPCSKRFCFLHRWITDPKDIRKRKSRLFICDIKGNILSILPSNGMFSHFCWRNNKQIIGYCSTREYGSRYHLFTLDKKGKCKKLEKITNLLGDGHPTVNEIGDIMVTDTYPNAKRIQNLYLYKFNSKSENILGQFHMPKKYQTPSIDNHWNVDLHPRLNNLGNLVSFDNSFMGERALATLNITELL